AATVTVHVRANVRGDDEEEDTFESTFGAVVEDSIPQLSTYYPRPVDDGVGGQLGCIEAAFLASRMLYCTAYRHAYRRFCREMEHKSVAYILRRLHDFKFTIDDD